MGCRDKPSPPAPLRRGSGDITLRALLNGDFKTNGAQARGNKSAARSAKGGSVATLVAVANAMAEETRQQPTNPETKPWP